MQCRRELGVGAVPSGLGSLLLGLPRTYPSASLSRLGLSYAAPSGLGFGCAGCVFSFGLRWRHFISARNPLADAEVKIPSLTPRGGFRDASTALGGPYGPPNSAQHDSLPGLNQLPAGMPPYFWSHFSSSRTLILPCQGFLSRLWPSPGRISSWLGMPSE